MTITAETRFNIGDTVYFLDFNHNIVKGTVTKIDADIVVYKDSYTGEQKDYVNNRYYVTVSGHPDSYDYSEDYLYSTPDEIVAMFNDQIEQGDFE